METLRLTTRKYSSFAQGDSMPSFQKRSNGIESYFLGNSPFGLFRVLFYVRITSSWLKTIKGYTDEKKYFDFMLFFHGWLHAPGAQ